MTYSTQNGKLKDQKTSCKKIKKYEFSSVKEFVLIKEEGIVLAIIHIDDLEEAMENIKSKLGDNQRLKAMKESGCTLY